MIEKRIPIWQRNLRVLAIAVFIAGIAFSEVMPFLPLYINTLGHFSHQQLNMWAGLVFSGIYFVSANFSMVGEISRSKRAEANDPPCIPWHGNRLSSNGTCH